MGAIHYAVIICIQKDTCDPSLAKFTFVRVIKLAYFLEHLRNTVPPFSQLQLLPTTCNIVEIIRG